MTKLLLAVPTYGPVETQATRALRAAMMHAANHAAVSWVGDVSPNRMQFAAARNAAVELALACPEANVQAADAMMWVDSDVVLPVDAVTRLVLAQKDFVTGVYVQREPPHFPLIAQFRDGHFQWIVDFPPNVVAPIDGCGFGCVLTSMRMLRALPRPPFAFETFSEDFTFCRRTAAAGFQLYVDTGVLCGHLREPVAATYADFVAHRDAGALTADRRAPQSAA